MAWIPAGCSHHAPSSQMQRTISWEFSLRASHYNPGDIAFLQGLAERAGVPACRATQRRRTQASLPGELDAGPGRAPCGQRKADTLVTHPTSLQCSGMPRC